MKNKKHASSQGDFNQTLKIDKMFAEFHNFMDKSKKDSPVQFFTPETNKKPSEPVKELHSSFSFKNKKTTAETSRRVTSDRDEYYHRFLSNFYDMDIFRHIEQLVEMRVNHCVSVRLRNYMLPMYDSLNEKFETMFNERMTEIQ